MTILVMDTEIIRAASCGARFGSLPSGVIWDHRRQHMADRTTPTGDESAHDVLAAEEFAMPAPRPGVGGVGGSGAPAGSRRALVVTGALVVLALRRRRRRRRRRNRHT